MHWGGKSFFMHEKQFPILKRKINGHPLVYLDNASTTQKPEAVLRAMDNYYRQHNANPHRGIHTLSQEATTLYEKVRDKIQKFINAKHREEIIFTSGATEAINLVVWTWGHDNIKRRDEILLTEMEHHSNLVPWQMLAKKRGAKLRFIPIITPSPGVGRG
jgi:cysteine desulfurase / selenocysteine lyase